MITVIFRPTNDCNLRCTYCYDMKNHKCNSNNIRKKLLKYLKKKHPQL